MVRGFCCLVNILKICSVCVVDLMGFGMGVVFRSGVCVLFMR